MCVVSMIMDHYRDWWGDKYWPPNTPWKVAPVPPHEWPQTIPAPIPNAPGPTPAELDEFRRLLDRAREYDRKMNQPDCELDQKRQMLKKMAEALGVDISFIDKDTSNEPKRDNKE